jgi:hypothetical protein
MQYVHLGYYNRQTGRYLQMVRGVWKVMPPWRCCMQAVWPWSGDYLNLFIVPWASVCHGVWLGKHCLHFIWFKTCFQPHWSVSKQRFIEFLTHTNSTPIGIHWKLISFYTKHTVDVKGKGKVTFHGTIFNTPTSWVNDLWIYCVLAPSK